MGIDAAEPQSLLLQAQAGDAEAYGELCRNHEGALLRHAASLCGNLSLAEDLAQDTLVEGWRSLRRYNGRCRFFTWLCAILLNRYRNTLRAKRPVLFSALGFFGGKSSPYDVADDRNGPDQALALNEQVELVRRCVQALPAKHRQVVYLRFFVDDSLEAIAAAMGCSVGTAKSRLFHALEKLRQMKELRCESRHPETDARTL